MRLRAHQRAFRSPFGNLRERLVNDRLCYHKVIVSKHATYTKEMAVVGKQTHFIAYGKDFQCLFSEMEKSGASFYQRDGSHFNIADNFDNFGVVHALFGDSQPGIEINMYGRALSMQAQEESIEIAQNGAGIPIYPLPVSRVYIYSPLPGCPYNPVLLKRYNKVRRYLQKTAKYVLKLNGNIYVLPHAYELCSLEGEFENNLFSYSRNLTTANQPPTDSEQLF